MVSLVKCGEEHTFGLIIRAMANLVTSYLDLCFERWNFVYGHFLTCLDSTSTGYRL